MHEKAERICTYPTFSSSARRMLAILSRLSFSPTVTEKLGLPVKFVLHLGPYLMISFAIRHQR